MASAEAGHTTVAGVPVGTEHYIGRKRIASNRAFAVHSPIDGRHLANIAVGGMEEVEAAVEAARKAFPQWAAWTDPCLNDKLLYYRHSTSMSSEPWQPRAPSNLSP